MRTAIDSQRDTLMNETQYCVGFGIVVLEMLNLSAFQTRLHI